MHQLDKGLDWSSCNKKNKENDERNGEKDRWKGGCEEKSDEKDEWAVRKGIWKWWEFLCFLSACIIIELIMAKDKTHLDMNMT